MRRVQAVSTQINAIHLHTGKNEKKVNQFTQCTKQPAQDRDINKMIDMIRRITPLICQHITCGLKQYGTVHYELSFAG